MDHPYLAGTPADFWRRYNRNMQQFFLEDVFIPMGASRRPLVGILFVFAVSGLLHELVFGIASGRVQGFQMAFFLIQGLAVAATARIRPRGSRAVAWAIGTLVFVLITSTLFFASMQGVVPFYSPRPS
jgi:D-alanyl-lipoteichoic acid acyltransferase DltB (MBOAT superfamily)